MVAAEVAVDGGTQEHVVVFNWFFRSRFPSSWRQGWGGSEVAGAVPRAADGVRAGEVLQVRWTEEGAEMDFMELTEPRPEVLYVCGFDGVIQFGCLFA